MQLNFEWYCTYQVVRTELDAIGYTAQVMMMLEDDERALNLTDDLHLRDHIHYPNATPRSFRNRNSIKS